MRWLSPPDSVPEARDEREVFEPDVDQELQPVADFLQHAHRDLVLLGRQLLAAARRTIRRRALTDMSATSPMCWPAILTHSASGLRRKPLQASQGMSVK